MKADKCGQELQNKELTEAKAPIRGEHAKKSRKFSPKLKQTILTSTERNIYNPLFILDSLINLRINSTIYCLPGEPLAKILANK